VTSLFGGIPESGGGSQLLAGERVRPDPDRGCRRCLRRTHS